MLPEGLAYEEGFVSAEEERSLLSLFDATEFRTVALRGRIARRTVRHFGLRYDYAARDVVPADPLPDAMAWLRDRCAALMGRDPADVEQVLVNRYPAGAGIGWHLDAPMFGPAIAGVSLGAPARMRFQRRVDGSREVAALELAPRSAYLLAGDARWSWQHSVPATKDLRCSVTFRTLERT